jgi:hypothetical protein
VPATPAAIVRRSASAISAVVSNSIIVAPDWSPQTNAVSKSAISRSIPLPAARDTRL